MTTTLAIAILRARMVARRSIRRAIDLLVAAGVAFASAVRYSLACARPA